MTTDFVTDLDQPLLQLTPKDFLTPRMSFTGIHAYGATGSGKSSATARMLSGIFCSGRLFGTRYDSKI